MNKRTNSSRLTAIAVLMILVVTAVLASCVDVRGVDDIDPKDFSREVSREEDVSEVEIPTPDGYTAAPSVEQIVNIAPSTVAIFGYCEPDSVIRVTGGVEDAETTANGGYYIICTDLKYSKNLLEITAAASGKKESLPREFVAAYNATADKRLDGNSVSVGVNSRLYFDKMAENLSGEHLYTGSELEKIKKYICDTYTAYAYDRGGGQNVEFIICLIPSVASVYPEIIPESALKPANTTLYDQILETFKQTRATVIDMREEFLALRDEAETAEYGGLYRVTDSGLTDYGGYLTYKAIMDKVAVNFPEALPRDISEFRVSEVEAKGGNMVTYRALDNELITEKIVRLVPTFSLQYGKNSISTSSISALRKFVDPANGDYNFFTRLDTTDNVNGVAERWTIDTGRSDTLNLPNALIYRDYASYSFADILAERFEKCVLVRGGEFNVNLSNTMQYARDNKRVVDYVIYILSEDSMTSAFTLTLSS